jgi:hypothetical protein
VLFAISDVFAWLLGAVSLAGAAAYPFAGPVYAKMANLPFTMEEVVVTVIIAVAVAVGTFLLRRRKPVGLLLVLLPCAGWCLSGAPQCGLWYGVFAFFIFGSPMVLSLVEMRQRRRTNERT